MMDGVDFGPIGSEAQRSAALDQVVADFMRECGPLTREGQILLARLVDGYAETMAAWRLEQRGYFPG